MDKSSEPEPVPLERVQAQKVIPYLRFEVSLGAGSSQVGNLELQEMERKFPEALSPPADTAMSQGDTSTAGAGWQMEINPSQ